MVQAIGYVALLISVLSLQAKQTKYMYLLQGASNLIFCVQMLLLGGYTGAVTQFVIMCKNFLLGNLDRWPWVKKRITLVIYTVICCILSAITWAGPLSLLPAVATVVGGIAYWSNNYNFIRWEIITLGCPLWIIYDVIVGSTGAAVSQSLNIVSAVIGMIREKKRNKSENSQ